MRIDYVQIHLSDLATLLINGSEEESLIRTRQACLDLVNKNMNSEFDWVREALESAETGMSSAQDKMAKMRAAKAEKRLLNEKVNSSQIFTDNVEQYDAISDADTPEASVRKEEEGEKSSVLCTSGAPASVSKSSARLEFEAFRKAYPGTRRGADVEWKAFCAKASPEDVALLMPALLREKAHKEECARVGAFCPQWANLSTWINQRRWTMEFAAPVAPQARKTSEEIENDKKARMLRWLKDREAGIPTGDNYDEIPEVENTEDGNA